MIKRCMSIHFWSPKIAKNACLCCSLDPTSRCPTRTSDSCSVVWVIFWPHCSGLQCSVHVCSSIFGCGLVFSCFMLCSSTQLPLASTHQMPTFLRSFHTLMWTWPLLNQQTFLFHDFNTMHAPQDFNPYGNPVPLEPLFMIFLLSSARSHILCNHLGSSGLVVWGSFYSIFICKYSYFTMFLNGLPPFHGLLYLNFVVLLVSLNI